tara:strand:+ start:82 stop:486 length:405 start_codon:yes stop_codon:yes gene_type:complete
MDALRGALGEIGFAGAVIARRTRGGSLQILDGHARVEAAGDAEVPVLVVDLTPAEARKLLATYDPLGAMAEADDVALNALLDAIRVENDDLQLMLDAMIDVPAPPQEFEPVDSDLPTEHQCPSCGYEWSGKSAS